MSLAIKGAHSRESWDLFYLGIAKRIIIVEDPDRRPRFTIGLGYGAIVFVYLAREQAILLISKGKRVPKSGLANFNTSDEFGLDGANLF